MCHCFEAIEYTINPLVVRRFAVNFYAFLFRLGQYLSLRFFRLADFLLLRDKINLTLAGYRVTRRDAITDCHHAFIN